MKILFSPVKICTQSIVPSAGHVVSRRCPLEPQKSGLTDGASPETQYLPHPTGELGKLLPPCSLERGCWGAREGGPVLLSFLAGEGVVGHGVEQPHQEDGQRSDGEEQDGRPEADFVHHLPDQHPVLHLLQGKEGGGLQVGRLQRRLGAGLARVG